MWQTSLWAMGDMDHIGSHPSLQLCRFRWTRGGSIFLAFYCENEFLFNLGFLQIRRDIVPLSLKIREVTQLTISRALLHNSHSTRVQLCSPTQSLLISSGTRVTCSAPINIIINYVLYCGLWFGEMYTDVELKKSVSIINY